jgi:hypothetical protein
MNSNIVFCTTCKNRTAHLSQTLPKNLAENKIGKFVVLDYNSQDNLTSYLLQNHRIDIDSGRLVIYSMPPGPNGPVPFHMAHAKNLAHRCGILEGADILVNLDADGFASPNFDSYIEENIIDKNSRFFMQAMWNRWVERNGSEEWLAEDSDGNLVPPVPKGSNGRIVATKSAFLLAGGYDEKYAEWGPDDKDFNIRMRRLGYSPLLLKREHQNTILHNDKIRFKEYPHAKTNKEIYFKISVHDSDNTIANFGNFGCGTVYRNFDFSNKIRIDPLPTRIFGIGMHKTATTSLFKAFRILGYDSEHWKNAHWARAIWREMADTGKSNTLERNYALSDLPIPILYKELDRSYPGSKFILTIRDDASWIDSVRRHWSFDTNPFRRQWDDDPFSHFIHKQIYGTKNFNHEIFLERYRRHNAEVIDYFKNRPNDLLVFNSSGWLELCKFLGHPIPDTNYPVMNGY